MSSPAVVPVTARLVADTGRDSAARGAPLSAGS